MAKIIVTLGPSTCTEDDLRKIQSKGVSFVRVNMSHSTIRDLERFIQLSKKVGIPFIVDTEGSQVRTGDLRDSEVSYDENDEIKIYNRPVVGDRGMICLKPHHVVEQLECGDIIHVDFNNLILRITDAYTHSNGYCTARVISGGVLGRNKAVVIDFGAKRELNLSPLSEKDHESIAIGLREGVGHIAASFMRSEAFVEEVRRATKGSMKIISKIECLDALENLDEIIEASDYLLIDRGDLSKEVPIEKIPFLQKIILKKAKDRGKGVFVATNLLETMVREKKPTRAEVNDVANTILDGAYGLALAAETAIGKHPMESITMLNKLISETEVFLNAKKGPIQRFRGKEYSEYLSSAAISSALIPPHGGVLIDRALKESPAKAYLDSLRKITIDENQQMDVEQIGIGTFSPIEGFMDKNDFRSVLDRMRLSGGVPWTIPILLDISSSEADAISIGDTVMLVNEKNETVSLLHVSDKYTFDKEEMAQKLYGTRSFEHPGVKMISKMKPILLGGKIDVLRRRRSDHKEYELTPRQVRKLFDERGWKKVVGFHTRNVIHRSHEFIQLKAMERECADGLFIHPIIGKKKNGDFEASYILKAYEMMMKDYYPKNSVVLSAFSTYSRYAGPREAIFTALCRKNFGCSHFIVGRDHSGVGDFYHPYASHDIFDQFPDLGIQPVKFDKVFYSKSHKKHFHEKDVPDHGEDDKLQISGTEARKMFERGESPPEWFMRPEISKMIIDSLRAGYQVFVE